jgi:hypothetical protein
MVLEDAFKCLTCGQINIVPESRTKEEPEPKEEWTIKTTKTVRRKFKAMCGRKGVDFNGGLFYLLGLDAREEAGMLETPLGVPGTK